MTRLVSLIAIFLFLAFGPRGEAAELYEGDGVLCDYHLVGEIVTGDVLKVAHIDQGYPITTLCLASEEGGNLEEGLSIFELIWLANINTFVLPGDKCKSACALAFMGGSNVQGTDLTRQIERNILPGATLAFHGPKLSLPDGPIVPRAMAQDSFSTAIRTAHRIFELTQIREKGEFTFSDFLFGVILGTPPSEFYEIETIGDAILVDVGIIGLGMSVRAEPQTLMNACKNTYVRNPPDLIYQNLFSNSLEYYRDFNTEELLSGVSLLQTRDEWGDSVSALVGPFSSGTKYLSIYCIVTFSSREDTPEVDRDFPSSLYAPFKVSLFSKNHLLEISDEALLVTHARGGFEDKVEAVETFAVPAYFGLAPTQAITALPLSQAYGAAVARERTARARATPVDVGCQANLNISQDGRTWVEVDEVDSFVDAVWVLDYYVGDLGWPYSQIFLTRDDKYAVVIGSINTTTEVHLFDSWQENGRIPQAARLTTGETYECAYTRR